MVEIDKSGLKLFDNDAMLTGYYDSQTKKFYEDSAYKNEIPAHKGSLYYNYADSKTYAWDGTNYVISTDTTGLAAKMTHDGLGVYKGEIDLLMGEEIGFHADGNEIRLGDFIIEKTNRHMLQSYPSGNTGMATSAPNDGSFYLWAGWNGDDNYHMVVNKKDGCELCGLRNQVVINMWLEKKYTIYGKLSMN